MMRRSQKQIMGVKKTFLLLASEIRTKPPPKLRWTTPTKTSLCGNFEDASTI